MRKLLSISAALLVSLGMHAQQPAGGVYAVLDSLVLNYVKAIERESVESKAGECDFLIGSVKDSLMRQHLAVKLFNYYREAPVMGDEEVAIRLHDGWFASGKVVFPGEFEALDAEMFCNMNRHTLIGMDAPSVKARKPCGGTVELPLKGRTVLMWFYDTACSKCVAESRVLPGVLEKNVDFPLTVAAFYTGRDKKAWREFRRSFKLSNPMVKTVHCWDPSVDSDYLRLYGVVSTPKMYLVAPEGSIIGRRLEVESLLELLPTASQINGMFLKNKVNTIEK